MANILTDEENINNSEHMKKYHQYRDDFEDYMIKYIIPDIIVFQLANAYYKHCLGTSTLLQHFNSMRDVFNIFPELDYIKETIIELLKVKYNLIIVNENPLILDKWR